MGISNLMKALARLCPESIMVVQDLSRYSGKRFAIEVSTNMYRFRYGEDGRSVTTKEEDTPNGGEKCEDAAYLRRFLRQWQLMRSHNIEAVYVFDGAPPADKAPEIQRRKRARAALAEGIAEEEAAVSSLELSLRPKIPPHKEPGTLGAADKLRTARRYLVAKRGELEHKKKRLIIVRQEHYDALRRVFDRHGILYVNGDGDGEKTCAMLCHMGVADVVVSDDTDAIPYGAPVTLRCFDMPDKIPSEICLKSVLGGLNMSRDSLVDWCILCGCDFTGTVPGIGWKRAFDNITSHKDIESWLTSVAGCTYRQVACERCNYKSARERFISTPTEFAILIRRLPAELQSLVSAEYSGLTASKHEGDYNHDWVHTC